MADLRDITALILDDNAHMRELMKATLSAFGMRHIYEAADGAAAMARLDLGDVDIAFVDLKHESLAHLGGIEFCRDVRKRPETEIRHLPLIVVTAYSELRYLKQAVDAGADGEAGSVGRAGALDDGIGRRFAAMPFSPFVEQGLGMARGSGFRIDERGPGSADEAPWRPLQPALVLRGTTSRGSNERP